LDDKGALTRVKDEGELTEVDDAQQFWWGGANGDGTWRSLVTIDELIDPRPHISQPAGYGRLIYTVEY
jgi:hypothetical protein